MALFYCLQSTKTAIYTHKRISVPSKKLSENKGYGAFQVLFPVAAKIIS